MTRATVVTATRPLGWCAMRVHSLTLTDPALQMIFIDMGSHIDHRLYRLIIDDPNGTYRGDCSQVAARCCRVFRARPQSRPDLLAAASAVAAAREAQDTAAVCHDTRLVSFSQIGHVWSCYV